MKVLIVKEPWASHILEGIKSWEIRGSNTNVRERVAIAKSGTGKVFGTVEVIDSMNVTLADMLGNIDKHQIHDRDKMFMYNQNHAWILFKPEKFKTPIDYNHKRGAVIWVNDSALDGKIKAQENE